ncbi:hypothetical protein Taro_051964 [Colocasia esculenta]|uniref:Uncharacterized protein n=1 Tax=Colocasia esculenta TaxID=4460 RepID=A0A843XIL3_COLES|nr:hypothetical protein [Colocasia esculenta]
MKRENMNHEGAADVTGWEISLANIADRNKRLAHDREPNRVKIFKIGRCKELPDGTEQWVDDESRSRYLSATSLDSESGSTPISADATFVSVMGKDRSGRIHYCHIPRIT